MDLMIHVTTAQAGPMLPQLAAACRRARVGFGVFFTGDGVQALGAPEVTAALSGAVETSACEHSWHQHMGAAPCPVELGSQTVNSRMAASTRRLLSL